MPASITCPFCEGPLAIVAENDLAMAFEDRFPVSPGHTLVIPRRHEADILRLSPAETSALLELVLTVTRHLRDQLGPDGFNIGVNVGVAAGQTVGHAHVHVIPRYEGDRPDPRGGVRWVLPDHAPYWDES